MEANTPTAEPLQGSHTEQEAPEPPRAPEPGCLLCSAGAAALGAALASRRVPSAGLLKMELLHPFPEAGGIQEYIPGLHSPAMKLSFTARLPQQAQSPAHPWLQSFRVLQC